MMTVSVSRIISECGGHLSGNIFSVSAQQIVAGRKTNFMRNLHYSLCGTFAAEAAKELATS